MWKVVVKSGNLNWARWFIPFRLQVASQLSEKMQAQNRLQHCGWLVLLIGHREAYFYGGLIIQAATIFFFKYKCTAINIYESSVPSCKKDSLVGKTSGPLNWVQSK